MTIPATRAEAIAAIVERDVARWGEDERNASIELNKGLSYGLALNRLAYYDANEESFVLDAALDAAALAALTPADWRQLAKGG